MISRGSESEANENISTKKLQQFENLLETMKPTVKNISNETKSQNIPESEKPAAEVVPPEENKGYSSCLEVIDKLTNKIKKTNELFDTK